jgi:hypothetical protein
MTDAATEATEIDAVRVPRDIEARDLLVETVK